MSRKYYDFYVIEPGDSVSGVFMGLYGFSAQEVARYLPAIAENNPHIKDLNRVRPGQWIDVRLSSNEPQFASHKATDMNELEREYKALSPQQKTFLKENPHVVSTLLGVAGDVANNTADAAAYTIGKLVQQYYDETAKYGAELARNYAKNGRGTLPWEIRNMILNRQPVQEALNKIPRFVQKLLLEEARKVAAPMRFNQARIMSEVRKIVRISPAALKSYNPFSTVLGKYAGVVKYAGHAGTVFSVAIPVTLAGIDSYKAYGTSEFGRTNAKGIGSVGGGLLGSAVGYGVCNLVFGLPSGGTSLFWCSVVVGAGAGIGLSKGLSSVSEAAYDRFIADSDKCTVPKAN